MNHTTDDEEPVKAWRNVMADFSGSMKICVLSDDWNDWYECDDA